MMSKMLVSDLQILKIQIKICFKRFFKNEYIKYVLGLENYVYLFIIFREAFKQISYFLQKNVS